MKRRLVDVHFAAVVTVVAAAVVVFVTSAFLTPFLPFLLKVAAPRSRPASTVSAPGRIPLEEEEEGEGEEEEEVQG